MKAAIAWRGVRAEALAQRGEHTTAVELAQAAVAIAAATDALLDHADARLALAAALRAAGRGPDADAEQGRAIELWEAKGATVLVERTRQTNAPAAAATPAPQTTQPSTSRRRVTRNRATAALVPFNAAMAAADFAAFRAQLSETYEEIDHPTGVSYGRDANVAALQHLMRSREASGRQEPLATLGDSLVLSRRRVHASATGGGRFDVGEYEHEAYTVAELDDRGRWCRNEVFAADHPLDAVACLYERHAALLPEGPERERARATARSVAGWDGPLDVERVAATTSGLIELVDHRSLHLWSARGADEYLGQWRGQFELGTQHVRTDEVLAVEPDALLVRHTYFGIAREGGGEFANPVVELLVFGADGLTARFEVWDLAGEAEALARFELVASTQRQRTLHRRVTPNAATAWRARFDAAVAARDIEAIATRMHAEWWEIDHRTGSDYGKGGAIRCGVSITGSSVPGRRQAPTRTYSTTARNWSSRPTSRGASTMCSRPTDTVSWRA